MWLQLWAHIKFLLLLRANYLMLVLSIEHTGEGSKRYRQGGYIMVYTKKNHNWYNNTTGIRHGAFLYGPYIHGLVEPFQCSSLG